MADRSDRPRDRVPRQRRLTLALLGTLSCSAEPVDSQLLVGESASPARLDAGAPAMFGCAGLVFDADLRCLLRKPKPLRAWLAGRSDPTIEVWHDEAPLASTLVRDRAGLLVEFEPARREGKLELRAASGEVWTVELAPTSERYVALHEAGFDLAGAGDLAGAQAIFTSRSAELGPEEATLMRCDAARLAVGERDFDRVLATAKAVGESPVISCVGAAHMVSAYVQLFEQPDFNAAEAELVAAEAVSHLDFETAIGVRYLRGVFDHRIGKIDESLLAFAESARLADLVGDDQQFMASATMQAVALARLGRLREAETLAATIEQRVGAGEAGPIVRDIRYDLAWIALLRREADRAAPDPSATLRTLIEDYTKSENLDDVARTRLHLVLALLQSADITHAELEFAAIDSSRLDGHSLVWYELAGFEIERARQRLPAAKAHLDRAEFYADLTRDREHHFRIWAARGGLARARGDRPAALAALRRASEIADELALAVPGSSGRSMLVTSHRRADAELVDLLVELDQADAAICAAVGVRARHLRAVWARLRPDLSAGDQRDVQALLSQHRAQRASIDARLVDAWQLPESELQRLHDELDDDGEQADELLRRATALLERDAPRWSCDPIEPDQVGDAVLTMAPSATEGQWWFMLWRRDRQGLVSTIVGSEPGNDRVERAIATLEPELAGVRRLEVIPVGEMLAVDIHSIVLRHPRLHGVSVVYSLGLGASGDSGSSPNGESASVVAGSGDLAAVADETRDVSARLAETGWRVTSQWSPTSADQPALMHFAGHGHHASDGSWASSIDIPGYGRLSAAQIVAGQHAPTIVVLGACNSGALSSEILDGGMNLAAAFLLAGADLVLAPSGPVEDQTALELSRSLYATLAGRGAPAFIEALALVQRERAGATAGPRSFMSWRAWRP